MNIKNIKYKIKYNIRIIVSYITKIIRLLFGEN